MAIPIVSLKEIYNLMKSGVVRYKKEDKGTGLGSIEEKYSFLTQSKLKEILSHPKLRGIRVITPTYTLVDDLDEVNVVDDLTPASEQVIDNAVAEETALFS